MYKVAFCFAFCSYVLWLSFLPVERFTFVWTETCEYIHICVDRSVWFLLTVLSRFHSLHMAPFNILKELSYHFNFHFTILNKCLFLDMVWLYLYRNCFICCFNLERGTSCVSGELFPKQNCNNDYNILCCTFE